MLFSFAYAAQASRVEAESTCSADDDLDLTLFPTARFTVADFNRMGGPAGFSYRLPKLGTPRADHDALCIAEGRVEEHQIRPGVTLVVSDLQVHHHYEATSFMTPRFSAIIMLQGQARAQLDRQNDVPLVAHSGISALYGDSACMTGIHPAGQRLRSVNLSLSEPEAAGDERASEMIWKALRSPAGLRLRRWQVQNHLLLAIEHLLDCGWDHPLRNLLREGGRPAAGACAGLAGPGAAGRSEPRRSATGNCWNACANGCTTRPARTTRWRRWPSWPA